MPLEIICNDITKMRVDAIVNAANSRLQQGGGVCGAIFAAAGADKLQDECNRIGYCPVGSAVITDGYALPAKHIIHTVGPVWQGGGYNEEKLLSSCYTSSLELALKHGLSSIAFPLISSGIFGYPKDEALRVAVSVIGSFLLKYDMMVYIVIFDKASYKISDKLFKPIKAYIDGKYAEKHTSRLNPDDAENHIGESFTEMLLRLIDESGKADPEVYKRANLDRELFLKISSNLKYKPGKNTALALAVALELNLDRTADLIRRAGYALSPGSRFDLIVEYFIREGNYNIFEINEVLFAFNESLLGA
ncbi:MAG TPA: macro domain-containing protein [Candidatus Diapherotrites archaeon]|nr:macro domain-containing protein [Bacillota bacterium]HRU41198.1 macro domain-containing protein [Candidatus Diapherotrites archaeon]